MKRFELKIGKFGHYFYDNTVSIDMTLEMVLNRLNYLSNQLDKINELNRKLNLEKITLNRKLTMKNEIKKE